MIKFDNFHELLERQLTRKEFLQTIGLMALSVLGVASMFGGIEKAMKPRDTESSHYGARAYGR